MGAPIQLCPYCRKQIVRPRPGVKFHSRCALAVDRMSVAGPPRFKTSDQAEQPIDIETAKASLPTCEAKTIKALLAGKSEPPKPVAFDWLSLPLIERASYLQDHGPQLIEAD